MVQLNSLGLKHDDSDGRFSEVLLKGQIAITREKNAEPIFHGEREQLSILDAAPAHLLRRDSVMPGQRAAQPPVQAFVNQDAHGSNRFQHLELGRLDDRDDLGAFNRGKPVQKILDGFATFEVINQVLQRNTRADEDRRAAHDFRIGMNHALQICHLHAGKIPVVCNICLQVFNHGWTQMNTDFETPRRGGTEFRQDEQDFQD